MYVWPKNYPNQCPPSHATNLVGRIFRFINGKTPTEKDFLSHYEKKPDDDWKDCACKARGLSVLRTIEDCQTMRSGIPALRKKRIAVAEISVSVGVIANTPSQTCNGHKTWWCTTLPSTVTPLFFQIEETPKEK